MIATGEVSPVARFGVPHVDLSPEDVAYAERASTQMLLAIALTGRHLYQGTVPAHVKARRRSRNKAARAARRVARR